MIIKNVIEGTIHPFTNKLFWWIEASPENSPSNWVIWETIGHWNFAVLDTSCIQKSWKIWWVLDLTVDILSHQNYLFFTHRFTYENTDDLLETQKSTSSLLGNWPPKEYMDASTATMNDLVQAERSVLYQLKSFGNSFSLDPLQLPATVKINQVDTNGTHFLVVTKGKIVNWSSMNFQIISSIFH